MATTYSEKAKYLLTESQLNNVSAIEKGETYNVRDSFDSVPYSAFISSQPNTLKSFVTDIADAIRSKTHMSGYGITSSTSGSTLINPQNFYGVRELSKALLTPFLEGTLAFFAKPLYSSVGAYAFAYCSYLSDVRLADCSSLSYGAFQDCHTLSNIVLDFSNIYTIPRYTFNRCYLLSYMSLPICTEMQSSAFNNCSSLSEVYAPNCSVIGVYTFYNCSNLQSLTLDFSNITNVGDLTFYNCRKLSYMSLPLCGSFGTNAFRDCITLSGIYAPNCSYVGTMAFMGCSSLLEIDMSKVTMLQTSAFQDCTQLSVANLISASFFNTNAFKNCSHLQEVSMLGGGTIWNEAFGNCSKLSKLTMTATKVTALGNTNAFANTPMSNSSYLGYFGSIYVPSLYLNNYKTATNWSVYSDRFVGI